MRVEGGQKTVGSMSKLSHVSGTGSLNGAEWWTPAIRLPAQWFDQIIGVDNTPPRIRVAPAGLGLFWRHFRWSECRFRDGDTACYPAKELTTISASHTQGSLCYPPCERHAQIDRTLGLEQFPHARGVSGLESASCRGVRVLRSRNNAERVGFESSVSRYCGLHPATRIAQQGF
ncbi:hypothetical protein VUR80DRAFT_2232 [Thermomyces stellatus]